MNLASFRILGSFGEAMGNISHLVLEINNIVSLSDRRCKEIRMIFHHAASAGRISLISLFFSLHGALAKMSGLVRNIC
jgi:hypothetical protein